MIELRKPKDVEVVARLVVHDAGEMSMAERRKIAQWLKRQAESVLKDGWNYSKRFTAKYHAIRG